MDKLDWTLTRSFLAVVETGSLSQAARQLGLSQPTLGRHIAELEAALNLTLFTRQPRGLSLTEAAAALVTPARAMRDAARALSLAAAGHEESLAGTVRLTASRIVSHYILPVMLADLRHRHPEIEIELVPNDASDNLLFREADIALRMYRPDQLAVITRHVADLPMALYAAHSFVARHGSPATVEDLLKLEFVGLDRSDLILRMMRAMGIERRREDFKIRCDDQTVYWEMVRAGCGIGGAQCLIGDADQMVQLIAPFVTLPSLPIWLTAPEALRQSPRIRTVFDYLAIRFQALRLDHGPAIG